MTTGEKIAKRRKEKGLTQSQLADILCVTRQAVSRWEGDLAFPETDTLLKLCKILGCSVDWLLDYNTEKNESLPDDGETDRKEFTDQAVGEGVFRLTFDLKKYYIEYKSVAHIGKLPLVHINIGLGRTAKGVIAVGLTSVGLVSVGLLSFGLIAVGLLCLGFIALGSVICGVFAAGAVSFGVIALGGVALGLFAMGGCAVGLFACGGYAAGYYFAMGEIASGGIAVGSRVDGSILSVCVSDAADMKEVVYEELGNIPLFWSVFVDWCRGLFDGFLNGSITVGIKVKI